MLLNSPTGTNRQTEPHSTSSKSSSSSTKTSKAVVKKVTNSQHRKIVTSKTSTFKRIQTKRKISTLITSILLSTFLLLLLLFEAVHCQNFRPPFLQPHVKPPHHKNVFGKPFQPQQDRSKANNNGPNISPPTGGGVGPPSKPGPPPPPPPPPLIGPTLPPNKNEEKEKKKRDGEDPFSKKKQPGPPPPPPPPPPQLPNPQQRRQQLPQLPPHRPPHRPRNIRPPLGPHLPPHFQHANNKPPFPPRHLPRGHIHPPPHGQGNNGNRGPPPPPPPPPHHKNNPRKPIKATATISFPAGIGRIPLEEIANILHEKHIEAAPPKQIHSSEDKNSSTDIDQDFSPSREVVDELDQDIPSVLVPSSHFPNNFHHSNNNNHHEHDHHHHHEDENKSGENDEDGDIGFKIEPRGQHSGPALINRISSSSFEENNGLDFDDEIERKDKLIKDALYFVQSNVRQADPYASSAKNPRPGRDLDLDDLHTSESRFHHHEHNHHSVLSPPGGHHHHHDHNDLQDHSSHEDDDDDNGDKDDELYKHVKELVDCGGRDLGFCDMSSHYPGHMMGDLMSECKNLVYSGFVPVPEDLQELQEAKSVAKYSNASKSSVRAELGSWSWKPYEYEKKQMCESELKFIRPGYARDSTGKWQVIVQTPHLPQRVAIDLCKQPEQPCHLMSDCGRNSRCVQRYNFQHLLALDPDHMSRCPTLRAFKFPSSCLCHMEVTDKGHGLF